MCKYVPEVAFRTARPVCSISLVNKSWSVDHSFAASDLILAMTVYTAALNDSRMKMCCKPKCKKLSDTFKRWISVGWIAIVTVNLIVWGAIVSFIIVYYIPRVSQVLLNNLYHLSHSYFTKGGIW